jgi:hypothetical protein
MVFVAAAPLHAGDVDEAPKPRLRVTDRNVRALIAEGMARSPAFHALVARLEQSDVVVYVRCGRLRARLDGQLTFVSAAAGLRYVVVQIGWDLPPLRKIATLGHELQHAIEIAGQPTIVDQASLAYAYGRIGFQRDAGTAALTAFDTDAAMTAGEQIWKELHAGASRAD